MLRQALDLIPEELRAPGGEARLAARRAEARDVLVVGVVTAGRDLVEGILTTRLPVDGDGAAEALAEWIAGSRFLPALRAVLLHGITIAGLSVVDLPALSGALGLPAIAVNRKPPRDDELVGALDAAAFPHRIPLIARAGSSHECGSLHFAACGIDPEGARAILLPEVGKSNLPEGLRLAHMIARGVVLGESRGQP